MNSQNRSTGEPARAESGAEAPDRQRFLGGVEDDLRRALAAREPKGASARARLLDAARHLVLAGAAKRARPRLVYACGRAAALDPGKTRPVAVAAELVHAASLLHDDVVDEAASRRGAVTVNREYGNTVAVLSGDLLITAAFEALHGTPRPVVDEAIEVVAEMAEAALAEAGHRGRIDVELADWRAVAEGKTGALLAWCGRAAGHLAGDEEAAQRLGACGRALGLAFQLADDLLDLEAGSGKDRLADLRARSPSYPLLVAAEEDEALRRRISALWADAAPPEAVIADVAADVERTGARARTREAIRRQIADAESHLGAYAATEGGAEIVGWGRALAARAVADFPEREGAAPPGAASPSGAAGADGARPPGAARRPLS